MAISDAPFILVLAGVNGAGKSSLGGVRLRGTGLDYFNPDETAKRMLRDRGCTADEANSLAWQEGKERLEAAISSRSRFIFESTLGGQTMAAMLLEAAREGMDVIVWFVGLATPEQHIERVRARVASGGHDIPEPMIRQRWDASRRNVIKLMPHLAELKVFDNSEEGDPASGTIPEPRLLLHMIRGKIVGPDVDALKNTPEWAQPIVSAALALHGL
jgi:predicted ABC-type ATPase